MKEQVPKYLLYDGTIRMGWSINFHNELLPKEHDKALIKGGGRIALDKENKRILFYALSAEFGECKKEDFLKAIPESWFSPSIVGYKIFWAPYHIINREEAWAAAEEVTIVPE